MVSVDGSVIVQVVNFLLLIWMLNMVLYKPVREILGRRKQKVSGLKLEVDDFNQFVSDRDSAYADGIRNARLAGQKEKEVILNIAADGEAEIIKKINGEAQVQLGEARDKINAEINAVGLALENDVNLFAKAISHKILGRIV